MKKLLFLLLLLPTLLFSQNKLVVNVKNVVSSTGKISIAVYNSSKDFLSFDHSFKVESNQAVKLETVMEFANLPPGTYALAVFHDENANGKLDTNFFGIPKEPVGFSIGKMKTFGPPSFQECSFLLDSNKEITVTLK